MHSTFGLKKISYWNLNVHILYTCLSDMNTLPLVNKEKIIYSLDLTFRKTHSILCMYSREWYYIYNICYSGQTFWYLDNAWISISTPVVWPHSYFLTANSISDEALQCSMNYPNIVRLPAIILRLEDDLGTSLV